MHFKLSTALVVVSIAGSVYSQQIAQDPGSGGVPIELVHLYYDEYPQGIPRYLRICRRLGLTIVYRYCRFVDRAQILKLCALPWPQQHQVHRCGVERQQRRDAVSLCRDQFPTRWCHQLHNHPSNRRQLWELPHRSPERGYRPQRPVMDSGYRPCRDAERNKCTSQRRGTEAHRSQPPKRHRLQNHCLPAQRGLRRLCKPTNLSLLLASH